jgi:hypothetical protein
MRKPLSSVGLLTLTILLAAAPARADGTLLLGVCSPSFPHPTVGLAWGIGSDAFRIETEYAGTLGEATRSIPSVDSIMFNLVFRTPIEIRRARVYAIGGIGMYGDSTGSGPGSGELQAVDLGIGAKVPIAGALKLRLEYRAYLIHREVNDPRAGSAPPQRLSAGLTVSF